MFSYVGYNSETIPVNSSIMNLTLDEDLNGLEEVAIVGYGTSRNNINTGAATTSVSDALRGQVAGVTVNHSSGLSGRDTSIRIRGYGSVNGNLEPLYVVDGMPVSNFDINYLSSDNIESTTILKESAATSIYGSRGANGVVLITTKNTTSTGAVIEEGITNLRFEIKEPYTIKTEEDVTVIEIETYQVTADYVYFTAPVLNENVFLTAKITNWEQYNLLPGEANVYFEGSYSGKTMLNPYTSKDTLTVSLGLDPNVVVKRSELKDYKSKQFIGSNRILDKVYEIEIRNTKKTNIDIVLMDRIPISQNKEIKVEDIYTGNSEYDSEKGLITWKLNMAPSETQKRKFSYQLKFPKYKSISL